MRSRWLLFGVLAVALLASALAWGRLPAEVPTHWNARGEPDGWSSRFVAALLLPLMIAGVALGLRILPKIDPRRENYEKFADAYWIMGNCLGLFFGLLHLGMLGLAVGYPIDLSRVAAGGIGVLLAVSGNYLGRVRPNWFLGIRTPWTLEHPEIWRRTHRLTGWLFVGAGIAILGVALLSAAWLPYAVIAAVVTAVLVPVAASFIFWYRGRSS
ncbi:MAG: DUF1648 domain-containing protein [Gemmatimonadales bacterium]|nr:DUF1648 domain-containing protein [Gemmatimonadales bacterium]